MNRTSEDNKPLPDFLKDHDVSVTDNLQENPEKLRTSPLSKVFVAIGAIWLIFIFLYLQFGFGWDSFAVLMPQEYVLFLTFVFLPPFFAFWLAAFIYRSLLSVRQAELADKGLKKLLYGENENALAELLDQSLQNQLENFTAAALSISGQIKLLQQEMNAKAAEFSQTGKIIDTCFSESLQKLSAGSSELALQCQTAAQTATGAADNFSTNAAALATHVKSLTNDLNPLINETFATADHLQNVLNESKNYISEANAGLSGFARSNQTYLEQMGQSLERHTSKLEKTFLQTADNCEEIYKRLDSGISHIENSLKTHKELAAEQSALLDKNSSYLDNKLGEYGRLISLEVEAMVERAGTLDYNVKKQLDTLSEARAKIEQILDGTNNSLEQKSGRAVKSIEKIISNLEAELAKLNDFIRRTDGKNSEIQEAAEKITRRIGDLSNDLGLKVDDLKTRAVEAIDKFNEVSGAVQKNTAQLTETADIIVTKGREGSESLQNQRSSITLAVEELERTKSRIAEIGDNLNQAAQNASGVFEVYRAQIEELSTLIGHQTGELAESHTRTENQLLALKKQYEDISMGNFIDQTSEMIEKLENIAIDINQFFNGDDDELWKKFYNGDHSVFVRHITKNLNRKQIVRIREEYEKNADFRALSDRYMQGFETLLKAAQHCEKPQIALGMLSGADIGKIYYIMARALNRLE